MGKRGHARTANHIGKGEQKEDTGEGRGSRGYTDKKENQIFLIYIWKFNSYMTNGLLIYGEIFAHFLID